MIKAVILDYSGVVSQHGSLFEPMMDLNPGLTIERSKELFNTAKISEISNEEYMNNYSKESWEWYFKQATVHEGIMTFLEENKLPVYIGSNHVSSLVQKEIDILGVRDYFKEIFVSDKLKLAKPNKEFFIEILNRIGLSANEVIFIDDQKRNLLPAKELGMKTIWVNNTKVDPFGDNADVTPDAEVYNLAQLNNIIRSLSK
jgi:2-haloacid dehalogenase